MSYSTTNQGGQSGNSYGGGKSTGPLNQISNRLGDTIQNQFTNVGQQSNNDFGRNVLPAIGRIGGDVARGLIPDNNYRGGPPPIDNDFGRGEMINSYGLPGDPQRAQYQGGPPQLDLSGMLPKTPAQKVAESQAGGGILKLRNKQPFNPNPTPMPMPGPIPGFGGGKGMLPGGPGYGGGKSMPSPIIQPGGPGGFVPGNDRNWRGDIYGKGLPGQPMPNLNPDVMPPDYRSTDGAGNYTMDMQNIINQTPTNTYGRY